MVDFPVNYQKCVLLWALVPKPTFKRRPLKLVAASRYKVYNSDEALSRNHLSDGWEVASWIVWAIRSLLAVYSIFIRIMGTPVVLH